MRRAGDALADAGYDVVEAEPPLYEPRSRCGAACCSSTSTSRMRSLRAGHGARRDPLPGLRRPLSRRSTSAGVFAIVVERGAIAARWNGFLLEYPLILSPIWTQPPFAARLATSRTRRSAQATLRLMRPVCPRTSSGCPLPRCRPGAGGLPAGVQVMGARFQDLACLEAAEAIETALGVAEAIDPITATVQT